jgi:hypothetical protein
MAELWRQEGRGLRLKRAGEGPVEWLSGPFHTYTNAFLDPGRGWLGIVAQICNLLYRRFIIGSALNGCGRPDLPGTLQNAILRYSRLQICATGLPPIGECINETAH